MMLGGKLLRRLFEKERLEPANIKTGQENVYNFRQLKQVLNLGIRMKTCTHNSVLVLRNT